MSESNEPAEVPEATGAPTVQSEPPAEEQKLAKLAEPDWLPKRLEQAKSSAVAEMLKTAGFASLDEIRAAREELQKIKDSQLSEQERAQKERDELKLRADRAGELESAISSYAARELSALNEAQSQAVQAIAGEDPARILATIEKLRPTWAAAATVEPQKPEPKPVTTTSQSGGPPDTGNQSPVDLDAEYRRIKSVNPFEAASLIRQHGPGILTTNQ